jgi:DNA mismatch repair ATPase MutS
MSRIVDRAGPGDVVLLNESFASTNEREGSRIARQIVDGLTDSGLRVIMVTHLYEFSHGLAAEGREGTVLLRAERLPDGARTFRVVPGEPLPTSHGQDIWAAVFEPRTHP